MKPQFRLVRRWEMATACLMLLWMLPAQAQPVNDMFANRTVISGTNTVVTGSNVGATTENGEPDLGYPGGASVWWSWTAPFAGTATISTAGSNFDTMMAVYTGSAISALTEIASNDQDGGLDTSRVVFDTVSNRTYQVTVDGYEGASETVRLSVQLGPLQPPPVAPAWALPDPYGRMVYSSNYAGKVIILDFWATWCGPCKAGMPDLVALQAKYGNDGLAVIGANVSWSEESAQTVRTFLATWTPKVNYQVVMSDTATDDAFGTIYWIPTTFIIDRQNILRKQYVGVTDGSRLERQILPLLYHDMKLTCHRSGDRIAVSWPVTAATFTLESTPDLTDPMWSAWPAAPTAANGMNTVHVPATGNPRYFRLRTQD